MWNQRPSFRFEIDNFSEKETAIASQIFVGDGCEWYISVYPKGDSVCDDQLCLFLHVANHKSLRTGWKRTAKYYFVVLNQSDKELARSPIANARLWFCEKTPGWGFRKTMPLSKFQEKGYLEKDRLIIEVYIQVVEAFDGEGEDVLEKKDETVDINGCRQVFASQVMRKIFSEHLMKTEYKDVLSNACSRLKSELDEVSSKRKKTDDDDDDDGSHVQQLEKRIKNLELIESGFKMDALNSDDANVSQVQKHEERIKNLESMISDLKVELEKEKAKGLM